MQIEFRKATLNDAKRLLEWRNDPLTRQNSFHTEIIDLQTHTRWLEQLLQNPHATLYIIECDGEPAASLRADHLPEGEIELSWTVDPSHRGKGLGKALLTQARSLIKGVLIAQIKKTNSASIKMAEAAGFQQIQESDGVLFFRYKSI